MYEAFKSLPIDPTLTVRNDYQQGYEWEIDVGPFSPPEAIEMAISLVNKEGYKIGKARMWWPDRAEQDRGLYKPVKIQGNIRL